MKRVISFLLATVMLILLLPMVSLQADAATSGYYTYTVTDGKATITRCDMSVTGTVTIPSTLGGSPVTAIGAAAFSNCTGLTGVIIPNGVVSIGSAAFVYCSALSDISIPNSVTTIEACAFEGCESLSEITIPSGVTEIAWGVFRGCTKLSSITLPAGLKSVTSNAFEACNNLKTVNFNGTDAQWNSVVIGEANDTLKTATVICQNVCTHAYGSWENFDVNQHKRVCTKCSGAEFAAHTYENGVCVCGGSYYTYTVSDGKATITKCHTAFAGDVVIPTTLGGYPVTEIAASAFANCEGITSITIPDNVTAIGESAFLGCTKLERINIPNGITQIGTATFVNCSALNAISLPDSLQEIGDAAFISCVNLAHIDIPEGVTMIGACAFEQCEELTSIVIPAGVSEISWGAFSNCANLSEITIGTGVTTIQDDAFSGCKNLKTVYYGSTESAWHSITIGSGNDALTGAELICGCEHTFSEWMKVDAETHQRFCTRCGETEVEGHSYVNGVCASNCGAMYYTYKVTDGKATITGCDTVIGGDITIPSTLGGYPVTAINGEAFYYCSGLTSVTIPDSVTYIGLAAFYGCSSLESIAIPFVGSSKKTSSDTYQYPFGYIFGMSAYPGSEKISQSYYSYSTIITTGTSYYIPGSLKSVTVTGGNILYGAFDDCSTLTSIAITNAVTAIGKYAFSCCYNLMSVTLPDGVTNIGNAAFENCSSLTSINIPDGVTTIGSAAFWDCDSLTSIIIPDSVTYIGPSAFQSTPF